MHPNIREDGTCEACGRLRMVGDWPACPHGSVTLNAERTQVFQDSIPGGLVLENYGPQPVKVYSHTERRQLMASRGLEMRERFAPMPGTDIDPQGIPNPKGYVDQQTLENGKTLILRQQGEAKGDTKFDADSVLKWHPTTTISEKEARQISDLVEKAGL